MAADPYDSVPYPTHPRPETHPDRLAAVATLFGMRPAPVTECRVLEIGCGDGGNLVPLAFALPAGRFTGVDLAAAPIAAAQRMAADLSLSNIRLVPGDLRDIDSSYGEFDYILAHGVYSWVPPEVRDALLRVCAGRLAPHGVAFVSYNALPGRHARQMLREMMLYHTRGIQAPVTRVERARALLHSLSEESLAPPAWRALLQEEAALLLAKDAGSFWHDDLAPVNHPAYFHEFAAHAERHGLQYLGEADVHLMAPAGEDEQHLDFLRCRRFRQTLLCRQSIDLDRRPTAARMPEFLFAAPARPCDAGQIEGLNGIRIAPGHPALQAIVGALGDTYPLPLPFEDLVPYAGSPDELAEVLFALVRTGFASLHVHDFPCQETVTDRPVASPLVRWQAQSSATVTNAAHTAVQLNESDLPILLRLDGTNPAESFPAETLQWFARMGLLVA